MVHYNNCRKTVCKPVVYPSGRNESLNIKLHLGIFFTKQQSLGICCLIFVVFKSFYRLLKIWPYAWYLPVQAVWLNILFISLLGFLRRERKVV